MWWRLMLIRIAGGKAVWLETHDGTLYLRWASPTKNGYIAHAISRVLGMGTVLLDHELKILNSGGVVKNVYEV